MAKYEYQKKYKQTHKEKIYDLKRKYYSKTAYAVNHKYNYTDEEIQMILDHNLTDTEIAKKIGRSVQAIQIKRSRLQKKGVN